MPEEKCANCKFYTPDPSDPSKGTCYGVPVTAETSPCPVGMFQAKEGIVEEPIAPAAGAVSSTTPIAGAPAPSENPTEPVLGNPPPSTPTTGEDKKGDTMQTPTDEDKKEEKEGEGTAEEGTVPTTPEPVAGGETPSETPTTPPTTEGPVAPTTETPGETPAEQSPEQPPAKPQ